MSRTMSESKNKKRVNSFFAGVGGFDLAFENEGFSPSFYCENNDFCRSVLRRHWPEVRNTSDISQLEAQDIPPAEVWTAGFPCQDLSLARTPHGKRSGLKGSRSGLFYKFHELLSQVRPEVVLLENVAGLLNSHHGADFNTVITSLTDLGYAVAWRVLNARYFGAPQSRPRVFICAWYGSPERAVRSLFEDVVAARPTQERAGFLLESRCPESGISVPQVSFCISATSGRHTGLDWARSYVTYGDSVRRLTPLECERLQGLPDHWTVPDKEYVVPIRGVETMRYHAVGNAVCIPVVQWIAARIGSMLEASRPRATRKGHIGSLASNLLSPSARVEQLQANTSHWKSGGVAYKGEFATAPVSPSPASPRESRFIDIVEKREVHSRYFLSQNAVQGILRRVDKLGRNLFPPLDAALRKIASKEEEQPCEGGANLRANEPAVAYKVS